MGMMDVNFRIPVTSEKKKSTQGAFLIFKKYLRVKPKNLKD